MERDDRVRRQMVNQSYGHSSNMKRDYVRVYL